MTGLLPGCAEQHCAIACAPGQALLAAICWQHHAHLLWLVLKLFFLGFRVQLVRCCWLLLLLHQCAGCWRVRLVGVACNR